MGPGNLLLATRVHGRLYLARCEFVVEERWRWAWMTHWHLAAIAATRWAGAIRVRHSRARDRRALVLVVVERGAPVLDCGIAGVGVERARLELAIVVPGRVELQEETAVCKGSSRRFGRSISAGAGAGNMWGAKSTSHSDSHAGSSSFSRTDENHGIAQTRLR